MNYSIEVRRRPNRESTNGYWLVLGNYRCNIDLAKGIAQDIAIELERETRVVAYRDTFRVHAVFSKIGQPLASP
jgi:hypothetical protein